MRKPFFSRGVLIFSAACLVCLFAATTTLSGHQDEVHGKRYAVLTDWTTHHVLYPLHGSPERMAIAGRDPRSTFSWLRYGPDAPHWRGRDTRGNSQGFDRDWSINLGVGGTAANMFPAKFTFDITAAPDCTNDYIVYPVNTAGSTTQANIVAFNNLYSGTAGGTGVCNRATPLADDDGADATVLWSYNVSAIGGAVTTSPVLSWDNNTGARPYWGPKWLSWSLLSGRPLIFTFWLGRRVTAKTPRTRMAFRTQNPCPDHHRSLRRSVAGSGTATDLTLGTTQGHPTPFPRLMSTTPMIMPTSATTRANCTVSRTCSARPTVRMRVALRVLRRAWTHLGDGVVSVGGGCGALTGPVEDYVTGKVSWGARTEGFTDSRPPEQNYQTSGPLSGWARAPRRRRDCGSSDRR